MAALGFSARRAPERARGAIVGLVVLLAACLLGGSSCARERPTAESGARPERLIALAPSLAETLFALGLGERVVGVGDYVSWPPEALGKPRLGGLVDPNLERIASLRPDLAILLPSERELAEKLRPLGVESLVVPNESLADVEAGIRRIAERCGVTPAGEALALRLHAELRPRPLPGRPRVLLVVERPAGRLGGLYVAGPGTFLDELIARLGADNVFADAPVLYPQASLEEIVARRPDVIVELRTDTPSAATRAALVGDWRQLPAVSAVANDRVRVVAGGFTLVPGPRLPELYRALAAALGDGGGEP